MQIILIPLRINPWNVVHTFYLDLPIFIFFTSFCASQFWIFICFFYSYIYTILSLLFGKELHCFFFFLNLSLYEQNEEKKSAKEKAWMILSRRESGIDTNFF